MANKKAAGKRVKQKSKPLQSGEYRQVKHPQFGTIWECCTPNGLVGNLASHTVTEHDDGTITVSPEINVDLRDPEEPLDSEGRESWYGVLEQGEWRELPPPKVPGIG